MTDASEDRLFGLNAHMIRTIGAMLGIASIFLAWSSIEVTTQPGSAGAVTSTASLAMLMGTSTKAAITFGGVLYIIGAIASMRSWIGWMPQVVGALMAGSGMMYVETEQVAGVTITTTSTLGIGFWIALLSVLISFLCVFRSDSEAPVHSGE